MQYQNETPQDYYDRTGQLPAALNPQDVLASDKGASTLVDAQYRPYINGVSQGPAYYIKPDGGLIDANDPNRASIYSDQTNNGQESGFGGMLKTISPALAVAGLGVAGGLAGLGGAAAAPGSLSAAGGGALSAGAGGVGTAIGAGGLGAVTQATGSAVPGGYSGAAQGGMGTFQLGDGLSPQLLGGAASVAGAANGLTSTQGSTFGIPNNILAGIAQGGLGLLGANAQGNALENVANQYLAIGAPYRGQLDASYQPGFNLASQPGYGDAFGRMADISARSYSAKMGNPADNPTAQAGILSDVWNQGYLPALTNYRGQLGQFGGLGLNTSGAASLQGADTAGGAYNAVGYGLGTALNPQPSITDLLKQMGGNSNYSLNIGGMKL